MCVKIELALGANVGQSVGIKPVNGRNGGTVGVVCAVVNCHGALDLGSHASDDNSCASGVGCWLVLGFVECDHGVLSGFKQLQGNG